MAGLGKARVDIIPPPGPDRSGAFDPGYQEERDSWTRPAFRALRLEHELYDLVYQQGPMTARTDGWAEYSIEWLSRLASLTCPT
jgi:hypothetical protein